MSVTGAGKQIQETVATWQGIVKSPHRYGGTEFRIGRREIGHVHGDSLVDIPFPRSIRNELVENGLAEPHHILPRSGWISFYLRKPEDIGRAITLLRRSYEIAYDAQLHRTGATLSSTNR